MAARIMFIQQKTGCDTDAGPCWIGWVEFNKSWKTARAHDLELRRMQGVDSNFVDVETGDEYWVSGPKRDQTDVRYKNTRPAVDDDAREAYRAFLNGAALPGREQG
jgi:hypothetical protein